eukprot:2825284-Rhodomonas_salina.1
MVLRARYAVSGTGLGYAAMPGTATWSLTFASWYPACGRRLGWCAGSVGYKVVWACRQYRAGHV